ncbi:Uncharacterised protein [Campylobacter insulaenigrae]|uniref:hypothetical protein n=1 Tax=Campylobacter insulaenigrae TaxID=260714 RepID=UPI000F6DA12B|nr:hypothetical protein [Campylobacter insulaenigrae]MCR6574304.1 hypothetical protein [Campylobacter insulaenigrae]MCR6590498.1 hypothetical protein [Campylobacter insulaenigrae]MCR6592035.1 hypothetical protein [Campylobacter insulaenigrae]VEJ53301.1 Uncharacterised protein [Campylobacter insulaenigrae]
MIKNEQGKKIKDTELSKITGMPLATIKLWKKKKDYRFSIYDMLKSKGEEELKKLFKYDETIKAD